MKQQGKNIFYNLSGFPVFTALVFMLLCYSIADAQLVEDPEDDSAQKALAKAISIYDTHIGKNSFLNTGSGYYNPYFGVNGHQYFNEDYWEQGSLIYEGYIFEDIYLKYDIYRDLLLIENFNSDGRLSPIQLFRPKVNSFELMGHYFIWIDNDTISNIKAGFYNQMYKGRGLEVLIKRRKEIVHVNSINSIGEKFSIKDRYYIKKNETFYKVNKKGSVIKVLEDRKKEIKSFIKKNNFRFKHNPDQQLVKVVEYYDSLF